MKKSLLLAAPLVALLLVACSDDSSSSSGGGGVIVDQSAISAADKNPAEPTAPASGATQENPLIIKNNVQLFSGDDIYYEKLIFKNETGGDYELYKGDETTPKQTSITIDGKTVQIPAKFNYDRTTFKITSGTVGTSFESYLFMNGAEYITAAEKLTTAANPPDMFSKWSQAAIVDGGTTTTTSYQITAAGDLTILKDTTTGGLTTTNLSTTYGYTASNGFVSNGDEKSISFYYAKVDVSSALYSYAQKATIMSGSRGRVSKDSSGTTVEFSSKRFLLLKI